MIRRLATDNALLLVQYAASALVPFLLIPHFVRAIGLSEFGTLAIAAAFGTYASIVVQYMFHVSGPVKLAEIDSDRDANGILVDALLAKCALFTGVVVVTIIFGALLFGARLTLGAWAIVIGLPLAALLNVAWFLQARGRFVPVCLSAIAGTMTTLSIGFLFVRDQGSASVAAAGVALAAGPVVTGLLTLLAVRVLTSFRTAALTELRTRMVRSLQESWPLFASQAISAIYGASGPVFVGHFGDVRSAGAYSVVERVINGIMGALLLTHVAAYPKLAKHYKEDRNAYMRMIGVVLAAYMAISICIAAAAWALRETIQTFLLGDRASQYDLLLVGGLAWLVTGIFGHALSGYMTVSGRPHMVLRITVGVLAIATGTGVIAVRSFGGAGWFGALVLSQILVIGVGIFYWRRERVRANGFRL